MPRQEVKPRIRPPRVGARIGANPITSISLDMIRATATPLKRSRTIAIATTESAAPETPCRTRKAARSSTDGAMAQSRDAVAWAQRPTTSGRRRPKASESGPITNWPRASPRSMPVSVSWTAESVAWRSSAMRGNAGRYMSIVSGPSAISAPSTSTSRA